jgi:hypothetical protein
MSTLRGRADIGLTGRHFRFWPNRDIKPDRIGPAINPKTANALGIMLGRAFW